MTTTLNHILHGGGKGILKQVFETLGLPYEDFDKALTERLVRGELYPDARTDKLRNELKVFFTYDGPMRFPSLKAQFAHQEQWAQTVTEQAGHQNVFVMSMHYETGDIDMDDGLEPGYWITFMADENEQEYALRMALREQTETLLTHESALKDAAKALMAQKEEAQKEKEKQVIDAQIAELKARRDAL